MDIVDRYLGSLRALGIDTEVNDIRFVEDNWENPTLGAWGLGWEVWMNGMEVTQFTYFQQVGGIECKPITGEITYGLERLTMYLQNCDNVFDLVYTRWHDENGEHVLTYGDVFHQNEVEQSHYNFEASDPEKLLKQFDYFESEAKRLMDLQLALPAYEMVLKAGHTFNLLDARGAISVTERAHYIGRIRQISRAVAQSYYDSRERLRLPDVRKQGTRRIKMASLLVELQTEELPPKALKNLSEAFAQSLFDNLKKQGFVAEGAKVLPYGSPRRLAVHISDVMEKSPDVEFSQRLVPVKVGLDPEGKPTKALEKKMAALGINVPVSELKRVNDGKQEQLFYDGVKPGYGIEKGLQTALEESIRTLPIPKLMSYQLGNGKTVYFVRPVKHLVALLDSKIIPVEVLGLKADRITMGHRFHTSQPIEINSADEYARQMCVTGKVIPSFNARLRTMVEQLEAKAKALDAEIIMPKDLVEEVAALTEFPVVYVSSFDKEFLDVPEECLILTMQQNQKYFALRDKAGKLMNQFLLVSQINAKDGGQAICSGNARVVRARLADAKFFYDQDRHETLESQVFRGLRRLFTQ